MPFALRGDVVQCMNDANLLYVVQNTARTILRRNASDNTRLDAGASAALDSNIGVASKAAEVVIWLALGIFGQITAQAAIINLNLVKYLDLVRQTGTKPNFVNNLRTRIKTVP